MAHDPGAQAERRGEIAFVLAVDQRASAGRAAFHRAEQRAGALHRLRGGERLEDVVCAHHVRIHEEFGLAGRQFAAQPAARPAGEFIVDGPLTDGVLEGEVGRITARPLGQPPAEGKILCARTPVDLPVFDAGAFAPCHPLRPVLFLTGLVERVFAAEGGRFLRRHPEAQPAPACRLCLGIEPCEPFPRRVGAAGKALRVGDQ